MYNPVTNAVTHIYNHIPPQILKEVFGKEDFGNYRRPAPVSIDEMIKSKVIRPRVLKDANLVGGRLVPITIDYTEGIRHNRISAVFQLTPEQTGNKEIISVLSANYSTGGVVSGGGGSGELISGLQTYNVASSGDVASVAARVYNSFASVPHTAGINVEIIAYNTIILTDPLMTLGRFDLRCVLANDEELTNISTRSYRDIATACELATKAYIYNNYTVKIDQGMLEQGQSLGRFKEIIDSYEDANEKYDEFVENVLGKVLFMNDAASYERFIKVQINPGL